MVKCSQLIKQIIDRDKSQRLLRMSAFLLLCCLSPNGFAGDKPAQDTEIDRYQALQQQLNKHLVEWEELRPAIKRLVSNEADLEFLITELSKMSRLKANPSKEQLANEKDILLAKKTINKAAVKAVSKTAEESVLTASLSVSKVENNPTVKLADAAMNERAKLNKNMQDNDRNSQFAIHLASYKRMKNLQLGWLIYQAKYSGLLKGKQPLTTDIVKDGIQYHRLLTGLYASKSQAKEVCEELKASQQYCRVVKYKRG